MGVKQCVLYCRVSPTKHIKSENDIHISIEESLKLCRADAEREGYIIVKEYIDQYVSGKSSKLMVSFNAMLADARLKKFDRVYCRRVNRFGRNRADMLRAQIELEDLDISLKFVENGIDTAQPFGKSIMAIMAELAEMEREEILENTRRGREARKEKGLPFGPKKKEIDIKTIRKMRLLPACDPDKPTWAKLEKLFNCKRATLIRHLKEAGYWDYTNRTVM
jgi:site-specific DNA recombinase